MKPFIPSSNNSQKEPTPKGSKRLCRNVIIHGFCKFQDKGCEFNHETDKTIVLPPQSEKSVSIDAPIFVPTSSSKQARSSITPQRSNTFPQFGNHNFYSSSDPYYYSQPPILQYHQYPPTLPHISNLATQQRLVQSFYIPDNLREQLIKRNESTLMTAVGKETGLPEEVHVYHSLYPLEDKPGHLLGHASWVYKAICKTNGKYYTLIRIEGFRLVNEQAMHVIKQWRKMKHANIVSIREAFTTRAFGDSSLIFVYDYHPCSITLSEAYFSPHAQAMLHARFQAAGMNGIPVPETTLWSFITQMASALQTVHRAGLAARNIKPNKIIMTSKNRLRICCTGLMDVLQYDGTHQQKIAMHQQEDLLSLGQLIVSLACHTQTTHVSSFEHISRFYSPDLKNVIYYLLGKPSHDKSMDDVISMVGPRMLHEFNSSQYYTDTLEANLSHELENSRLVRLLVKLNFINERPEFDQDPAWSESGEKFMIKLFRDYIFHQVNEVGVPMVDMAHVIACLNKLDAGVDEKILLTSRDDQASIIVTYKELKACIASAFNDVYNRKQ